MEDYFFKGIIFLLVGVILIIYLRIKNHKDIYDVKGYIGGFGSILFGLYLIFQFFNH
jgi:uncharacterized membrane protein HdeD (DUF308 family)